MQRASETPVAYADAESASTALDSSVLEDAARETALRHEARVPAPSAQEVRQSYAVVESVGTEIVVTVGDRRISTIRAASCLLEPRVSDQVLVAISERGPSFVLSVLVQASAAPSVLSTEGDLTLRSNAGKVSVVGAEGVNLTSGTEVSVSAPELNVRALSTTFFSESLSYLGRKLDAEVERLKVAAQTVDRVFDRVSERVKRSYRTVEEVEHVKARELDVVVEGNASLHAENTLVSADKLVKLDGEQVHLG